VCRGFKSLLRYQATINDLALNSLKQKKNVRLFKKSHVRHPQTGSCDLDPFAPRGDRKKSSHCRNHSQGEGVHCLHAAVPQGSRRALPRSPNLAPCPRGTGEAQNYSEDKSQDCSNLRERPTWRFEAERGNALRCDPPRQRLSLIAAPAARIRVCTSARGWAWRAPVGFSPLHPIGGLKAAPRHSKASPDRWNCRPAENNFTFAGTNRRETVLTPHDRRGAPVFQT